MELLSGRVDVDIEVLAPTVDPVVFHKKLTVRETSVAATATALLALLAEFPDGVGGATFEPDEHDGVCPSARSVMGR